MCPPRPPWPARSRSPSSGWVSRSVPPGVPAQRAPRKPAHVQRIPILSMGEFLLVTVQVDMHDRLATALKDDLANRIADTRARGVLIDISALDIVDSFIARMF